VSDARVWWPQNLKARGPDPSSIPLVGPRVGFIALCLLTIAFAGCAGSAKDTGATPSTSAAVPIVDEDSGSIHGFVLDDQVLPLRGADVAIVALELSTMTDEDGEFTLNDVPPGTHSLFASKLGYESRGEKVDVVAGEVRELQVVLVPMAIAEPHHESIPFAGEFQCSLAAFDVTWMDCGAETKSYFYFEKPEGVDHLVAELHWTSASAGTGQNLDFNLVKGTKIADTNEYQWYANVFGPSPLRIGIDVGEQFENPDSPSPVGAKDQDQVVDDEDTHLGFNIYASPTYAQDVALVGLTLQQKFNGYVTLFYDEDVPEGFSAFPDA
jgi:hypothetical protein